MQMVFSKVHPVCHSIVNGIKPGSMHDVTRESAAAVTDHFADAFVRENVARVYMTLTPFCCEKSCVRKGIFNV